MVSPSVDAPGANEQAPPQPPESAPEGFQWRRWMTWVTVIAITVLILLFVALQIRLPYYTISPGSALDLLGDSRDDEPRISVEGAESYPTDDEILLLFVRESARVNVWEWIQASLDSDIDLFKEQQFTGGLSPEEVRVESDADMARSQIAAKKVALEAAGYTVATGEGLQVLAVQPSRPAADALETGDVLLSVDGATLTEPAQLADAVKAHDVGDTVELGIRRGDEEQTVQVGTEAGPDGTPVIGVIMSGRYDFPVDVDVDTSEIGGPSAGLAMTLSILDRLTPGDLTGGEKVAVTGTIAEDGSVGEIGGLGQKAGSAKNAGAELFIVPACTNDAIKAECEAELDKLQERAGDLRVVPVATFAEALVALRDAGGDPVDVVSPAA
jgi:Lon-like protease